MAQLLLWERLGVFVLFFSGAAFHFVYIWSGQNPLVGLISPVNESTWEHLKMLYFPTLVYSAAEYAAVGHRFPSFLWAKLIGIIGGMAAIVGVFYLYTHFTGKNYLWADIALFLLGVMVCCTLSSLLAPATFLPAPIWAVFGALALLLCFVIFTAYPPRLGLFRCPVTKRYGLDGRKGCRRKKSREYR